MHIYIFFLGRNLNFRRARGRLCSHHAVTCAHPLCHAQRTPGSTLSIAPRFSFGPNATVAYRSAPAAAADDAAAASGDNPAAATAAGAPDAEPASGAPTGDAPPLQLTDWYISEVHVRLDAKPGRGRGRPRGRPRLLGTPHKPSVHTMVAVVTGRLFGTDALKSALACEALEPQQLRLVDGSVVRRPLPCVLPSR